MRSISSISSEVDALAARPVAALCVEELQRLVADTSDTVNRLCGVRLRALAELELRGGGQVPDPAMQGAVCPTPAWLRGVAKMSGHHAGLEIRTAVALRELPAVSEAIVDGEITTDHGRVLTRLVGKVTEAALLDSQPALIEVARRTDPDQLAHYVRHLLATWCEPQLDADEAAAEDARFFTVRNTHNGRWRGSFDLPDAAMEPVLTVLNALARREGDADARSAGQRRADAFSDVFALAARHAELPQAGGARPLVNYVVPSWWGTGLGPAATPVTAASPALVGMPLLAGLLDLDRHPGVDCATGSWTGPTTRAQIATLLCDARVQRVVLDETGQVVSLTSGTDQITAAQRRAVAARDRCCTSKGCSRPAAFCDVHHLWARADGGPTTVDNLVLLCRRHHVMWHRQQLGLTDLRVPWKRLPQPRSPDLA
jgi:hypothetical protein